MRFPRSPIRPTPAGPIRSGRFAATLICIRAFSDAGAFGCRLEPSDAYRFARGEEVVARQPDACGCRVRSTSWSSPTTPTTWASSRSSSPATPRSSPTRPAATGTTMIQAGGERGAKVALEIVDRFTQEHLPARHHSHCQAPPLYRSAWEHTIKAADDANDPGTVHRVHRLRMDLEHRRQQPPPQRHLPRRRRQGQPDRAAARTMPPAGSDNPRDLWKWMAAYEDKTGGGVLAIAHNGNLSQRAHVPAHRILHRQAPRPGIRRERARWEPLYEATQIKGDGESHPFLSPNDEFASFEVWDKGNLDLSVAKKPEMLQYEYARSALKLGLKLEQDLGINPYKFGMIGIDRRHTGLATAEEDNFFGKTLRIRAEPGPLATIPSAASTACASWNGSRPRRGYAGVWATENTREAIFDAMQRRETYATTGPRMSCVSSAAGTSSRADAQTRKPAVDRIRQGRTDGRRPQCGTRGKGRRPSSSRRSRIPSGPISTAFRSSRAGSMPRAERRRRSTTSPGPAPQAGERRKVAAGRQHGGYANATWTNTIGDPELIAVWKDPDFDAAQRAFYYLRVIEIPTPRGRPTMPSDSV